MGGVRVQALGGFKVQALGGFKVQGLGVLGFSVWVLGFRVSSPRKHRKPRAESLESAKGSRRLQRGSERPRMIRSLDTPGEPNTP